MTKSPKLSRRSDISPFLAMDALREAKELERAGRQIIHMELGSPEPQRPAQFVKLRPPLYRKANLVMESP